MFGCGVAAVAVRIGVDGGVIAIGGPGGNRNRLRCVGRLVCRGLTLKYAGAST